MKVLSLLLHLVIVLSPLVSHVGIKTRVKFVESCLKRDKITLTHNSRLVK